MSISIAIAGATGYAGGEIIRLVMQHPLYAQGEMHIGVLTGNSSAGLTGAEALPHIPALANQKIEKTDPDILAQHDVIFLALPHGHSARIAKAVGTGPVIIDCAADYRLRDAKAWDEFYGGEYAGSWPYGIPELPGHRAALKATRQVAVPGCFPTGATLAIYPALQAGLITPDITITSITGISGAGKKAAVSLLGAETMGSLKAYNTAGIHRHVPEIKQNLSAFVENEELRIGFTPVLAPLPRGILTVASAPLVNSELTTVEARKAYFQAYGAEACIQLLPEGIQPQTQHVLGSNLCQIQIEVDKNAGKLLMTSAIDNLTKGTAGAAVQCMNIVLGLPETSGLPLSGVAP
ncbi:N-acetyl-gamma-glutamyl-phosphate reductase [Corynebacterium caspium]|uniref:N-acetyl-gamma-glutamyl-phosphate reductase n=1 Tax=Corynebacterium caspium TaxID=234828 RepID=UPI00036947E2|nr:N-acetyl-gamma-glutamyl-phosphate reductase [Corynebacterium caspium]WKD59366.1 N-acetyl-gamma-glutamyl-phosphate reductase [Corynebacterium caspium DSM 44850]